MQNRTQERLVARGLEDDDSEIHASEDEAFAPTDKGSPPAVADENPPVLTDEEEELLEGKFVDEDDQLSEEVEEP